MTALNLAETRFGETVDGNEIAYFPLDSMALPAELVEWRNGVRKVTRYDSRFYALAVFAQETEDKALLTAVQEAEPCDCDECFDCEMTVAPCANPECEQMFSSGVFCANCDGVN